MSHSRHSTPLRWGVFVWLVGLLCLACSGEQSPEDVEFGVQGQAISDGSIDEDERWPGVVMLTTMLSAQSVQMCTGTLVAPNLVISALHCVAPLRDANFQCMPDGSVKKLKPGAGELGVPTVANQVVVRVGLDAASSEVAARGKVLVTTNSLNICNNDLALIQLDTELDLPLSRLRLDDPIVKGEPLTVVGYGTTTVDDDIVTRRFVDNLRVSDLGSDLTGNTATGAPPRTFVVGPSACKGDSGGPAYSRTRDGAPVVVGVDSLIIGECGASTSRAVFTRLAPFKKLILSAFEGAGYPAWEEEQLEPGVYPSPIIPDAGTDGDDTSDEEVPATGQRLKTGCSIPEQRGDSSSYLLAALPFAFLWWLRRNTTPTSFR